MSAVQQGDDGRARLSKAAVVEHALKLADADGLDALTIRRLAADIGVTPMALYWHFRSKEDLLEGLAEAIWGEIEVRVDPALSWSQQLRGGMESLVSVLRAHPCAARLLIDHEAKNEAMANVTEAALEILRSAGFDSVYASKIAHQVLWTGIMLVMGENGFDPGTPLAERDEAIRLKRLRFSMLPPDKYPRLVECAIPMTDCDDPEFHYNLGINIFIAGVEALAPGGEDPPRNNRG
jgi:TetR/AcrR family transcriptional regulator, tetracycline repressor protein